MCAYLLSLPDTPYAEQEGFPFKSDRARFHVVLSHPEELQQQSVNPSIACRVCKTLVPRMR